MRLTLTREFFIPAAELAAVERREGDVVTYAWEADGKILAKGFAGRKNKPVFYHRYNSVERRQAALDKFFADQKEISDRVASRKAAAKAVKAAMNAQVDLPIGTILVQSWGWEQTNINYFKVVGHFGRVGVQIVAIGAKQAEGKETGNSMADYCVPDETSVSEKVVNVRQDSKDSIKVTNTEGYAWGGSASKWDGKPEYRSWYA